MVRNVREGALVRSSVSDAVPLVPRGWDIGPTIPMGISSKGDLYLYIHTYVAVLVRQEKIEYVCMYVVVFLKFL